MVKIHRIWFNTERMDREDHYKITLFSRPRVSIHVDEYIWSFIEENIVKPHKLMRSEKHEYLLDIAFGQFDPAKHRYFPLSSYNGLLREGVEMDSAISARTLQAARIGLPGSLPIKYGQTAATRF